MPQPAQDRQDFYDRLSSHSAAPLWEVLQNLLTPVPQPDAVPHLWRYADLRPLLMESGRLLSAEEAERRVLMLENPSLAGEARTTDTLYAGLQLILPGEIAPAHRHSASALRFILEGGGAFTSVDGERAYMERGDLILTPNWLWHDHGNESGEPMVWLDGLDLPVIGYLKAMFAEGYSDKVYPETRPAGDNRARFGSNMRPADGRSAPTAAPVFHYTYADSRAAVEGVCGTGDPDPCHGYRLEYINPLTGGAAMATMSSYLQILPKGLATAPYRASDSVVYAVAEGTGTAALGDSEFRFAENDVFAVPAWVPRRIEASAETVLFSFSDRALQQALGLWRESRGAA